MKSKEFQSLFYLIRLKSSASFLIILVRIVPRVLTEFSKLCQGHMSNKTIIGPGKITIVACAIRTSRHGITTHTIPSISVENIDCLDVTIPTAYRYYQSFGWISALWSEKVLVWSFCLLFVWVLSFFSDFFFLLLVQLSLTFFTRLDVFVLELPVLDAFILQPLAW